MEIGLWSIILSEGKPGPLWNTFGCSNKNTNETALQNMNHKSDWREYVYYYYHFQYLFELQIQFIYLEDATLEGVSTSKIKIEVEWDEHPLRGYNYV